MKRWVDAIWGVFVACQCKLWPLPGWTGASSCYEQCVATVWGKNLSEGAESQAAGKRRGTRLLLLNCLNIIIRTKQTNACHGTPIGYYSLHSLYTTIIIITNTNIALQLMQLDLLPFEVLTESPNNLQMYSPNEFSPSSSFIFDGSITWEQSKCDPLEPLEEHPSIEQEALINWQNNQPNHHHLFLYQY